MEINDEPSLSERELPLAKRFRMCQSEREIPTASLCKRKSGHKIGFDEKWMEGRPWPYTGYEEDEYGRRTAT
jgi:hypothetical protein